MIFKQLADNNGINNVIMTQKIQQQQKKKIDKFFRSLIFSKVKFNKLQAVIR